MTISARHPLLYQARRLLWRSFVAAFAVGTLIGGLIGAAEGTASALGSSSRNLLEEAANGFLAGIVFAAIVWIPCWILLLLATLAWLWVAGVPNPHRTRTVLAVAAFVVLIGWMLGSYQSTNWVIPVEFLAPVLAGVGVWAVVPWILTPPRMDTGQTEQ